MTQTNQISKIDEPRSTEVATEAGSIVSIIDRVLAAPNFNVESVERLLAMQERVWAREAERAFNAAMQAAQAAMPQVIRDGKNSTTNSKFAKLETVAKAMSPVISKHGFALSFGTDVSPLEGHYRVTCHVTHAAGHSRDYQADIPADGVGMKGNQNKTATHAFGSTLSYGRRYLTLLIFNVATTDDDGQAASAGDTIDDDQVEKLRARLDETGSDVRRFCEAYRIEALPDLPAAKFFDAMGRLAQKAAAKAVQS